MFGNDYRMFGIQCIIYIVYTLYSPFLQSYRVGKATKCSRTAMNSRRRWGEQKAGGGLHGARGCTQTAIFRGELAARKEQKFLSNFINQTCWQVGALWPSAQSCPISSVHFIASDHIWGCFPKRFETARSTSCASQTVWPIDLAYIWQFERFQWNHFDCSA